MRRSIIYYLFLVIITLSSCVNEDNALLAIESQVNQVVITSIDYVNSNTYESTSEFDYSYENNKLMEIWYEGKKHITFEYQNEKVVEKRYFNNIEEVINIETFTYDQQDRLMLLNLQNNFEDLIQSKEIIYELNQLSKLKETFYFPTTSVQEYEFIYSGSNIDSVIFSTVNQSYICDYYEDSNNQNLKWFIEKMGQYQASNYAINSITLPIIFSSNRIKSVRGYNTSGSQSFEFLYDHVLVDDQYSELYFEWYDQNQEILNSTKIEFKH